MREMKTERRVASSLDTAGNGVVNSLMIALMEGKNRRVPNNRREPSGTQAKRASRRSTEKRRSTSLRGTMAWLPNSFVTTAGHISTRRPLYWRPAAAYDRGPDGGTEDPRVSDGEGAALDLLRRELAVARARQLFSTAGERPSTIGRAGIRGGRATPIPRNSRRTCSGMPTQQCQSFQQVDAVPLSSYSADDVVWFIPLLQNRFIQKNFVSRILYE